MGDISCVFKKKERISILFYSDWNGEEKENRCMRCRVTKYSLTNIANQVMNLLPFGLTQHQQNVKHVNVIL